MKSPFLLIPFFQTAYLFLSMTTHPILSIYHALLKHRVRFLLMGGQACIFYGASEFTRDSDFCVFCDQNNLLALQNALASLQAENTFFPLLEEKYLLRGHACHFICRKEGLTNFRIDIMAKMRNCPDFEVLWQDRNNFFFEGMTIPVMGVSHLVQAKKTQRDKDWPMVRRLVEEDYRQHRDDAKKIDFWLLECRTPEMLRELVGQFSDRIHLLSLKRPLLLIVNTSDINSLEEALLREELNERQADRAYWEPLKKELEQMRHDRTR
ncbi:MAG: hypothetical protein A2293_14495 [Elusimicrobia bacterium RIFOXYB2_FULL_49_7]|nr:MAG: hypothetical protein A2293_14495 [Elusimicrobia bacterium RIFOXYB2_FULL_49_7]